MTNLEGLFKHFSIRGPFASGQDKRKIDLGQYGHLCLITYTRTGGQGGIKLGFMTVIVLFVKMEMDYQEMEQESIMGLGMGLLTN
jgi:hypothetical protein